LQEQQVSKASKSKPSATNSASRGDTVPLTGGTQDSAQSQKTDGGAPESQPKDTDILQSQAETRPPHQAKACKNKKHAGVSGANHDLPNNVFQTTTPRPRMMSEVQAAAKLTGKPIPSPPKTNGGGPGNGNSGTFNDGYLAGYNDGKSGKASRFKKQVSRFTRFSSFSY
jgi:hypothetical protein